MGYERKKICFENLNQIIYTAGAILDDKERTITEEQQQEVLNWKKQLDALDRETNNNNRRHRDWRSSMDMTIADREPEENEYVTASDLFKLSAKEKDWLDYIFSQRFEDLPELTSDENISAAIKTLTDKQKETLYLSEIMGYDTKAIVEMKGTSNRNITDHRKKAIRKLRKELGLSD